MIRSQTLYKGFKDGFTLIETLVAISLLVIAIAAPMSLASQSITTAYYARDQITAFHLAQEAIEAIRSIRDKNILLNISGTPTNLLEGIPNTIGQPFTIDVRNNTTSLCSSGPCPTLKNSGPANGSLYGYGPAWGDTRFTRTVWVTMVGSSNDEVKVLVEVRWRSGPYQERFFTINENLYRWIEDTQ